MLRPLLIKDAISLRELANSPKIADTCVWLPYPCSKGLAKSWIRGAAERYAAGTGVEFGIQLKDGEELLGVVGFDDRSVNNATAELGFLLDPRWWGNGYATEAADVVVWYGFKYLKLNRIYAHYQSQQPGFGPRAGQARHEAGGPDAPMCEKGQGVRGHGADGPAA